MRNVVDTIIMLNRDPDWPAIPGYTEIVKSLLLEMKRREPVAQFPDSMKSFSHTLLVNYNLITSFTRIIFLKSSIYNVQNVSSSIEMLDSWIESMKSWDHRKAYWLFPLGRLNRFLLPPSFDFEFFFEAVRRLLDSPLNQVHMHECSIFLLFSYSLLHWPLLYIEDRLKRNWIHL
jgi:hypothetical protein